jgi:tripeptidyl-peptidase-1
MRVHMSRYRYGADLSKEQVAELVAYPDTLELVDSWFEYHEVPSLAISITHGWGHTEMNETVIHTVGYSLPAALREHVQTVAPTTYPGSPRPFRQPLKLAFNAPTLPDDDLELQDWSAAFAPGNPILPTARP